MVPCLYLLRPTQTVKPDSSCLIRHQTLLLWLVCGYRIITQYRTQDVAAFCINFHIQYIGDYLYPLTFNVRHLFQLAATDDDVAGMAAASGTIPFSISLLTYRIFI